MFNVKTDFGFIGRLFGVPRSWLSKVGAFCSSWVAEGRIIKLVQPDCPDPMNNPIIIGVDEDALREFVDGLDTEMGAEPVDNTPFSDLTTMNSGDILPSINSVQDWQCGGANGLIMQVFAISKDGNYGSHRLYPLNLHISSAGKIVRVEYVRNFGIKISS